MWGFAYVLEGPITGWASKLIVKPAPKIRRYFYAPRWSFSFLHTHSVWFFLYAKKNAPIGGASRQKKTGLEPIPQAPQPVWFHFTTFFFSDYLYYNNYFFCGQALLQIFFVSILYFFGRCSGLADGCKNFYFSSGFQGNVSCMLLQNFL